jgi:hypothetical protein
MDLQELSNMLHDRQLDLLRLTFGEMILLPKVNEVERIQQYRPICFLDVSFKIFVENTSKRLMIK